MELSEYQLVEEFNPPSDWRYPKWTEENKVHNWRNYVSPALQKEWRYFTENQMILLSSSFDAVADREEWD